MIEGLLDFLQVEPDLIACDAHPDYPSTWLAEELAAAHGVAVVAVQHHLAHVAAVLAEHGRLPGAGERAVGLALDGTGWGPDATAWGGEWLEIGGDLHVAARWPTSNRCPWWAERRRSGSRGGSPWRRW